MRGGAGAGDTGDGAAAEPTSPQRSFCISRASLRGAFASNSQHLLLFFFFFKGLALGAGGRLRLHAPGSWLEVSGIYCPPAVLTGGQGIDGPSSGQLWGGTRTPESSAGGADAASRPLQLPPPRPASRSHCPRHFPRVRIVKNPLAQESSLPDLLLENSAWNSRSARTPTGGAFWKGVSLLHTHVHGPPARTSTCRGTSRGHRAMTGRGSHPPLPTLQPRGTEPTVTWVCSSNNPGLCSPQCSF